MAPARETKSTENQSKLRLAFKKRTANLFKKAKDLSILTDCEIALLIYSNAGNLYEFASSSMGRVLARYKACLENPTKRPELDHMPQPLNQMQVTKEVDVVKKETEKLKISRLLSKDLMTMNSHELEKLQQTLREGLICMQEKKEKLLLQEVEQSKVKILQTSNENESLRRQVEELQGHRPLTRPEPLYIEYPTEEACDIGIADDDSWTGSEISLELGL